MYQNESRARLCHLRRWPDFNGFGFNLHCDRNKSGQYIGKVDANSPAESAGLREHDRIIEVNFVPIGDENHRQVVSRIKEGVTRNNTKYPDEVILLVVDPETDRYNRDRSIVVSSSDPNIEKLETEDRSGLDRKPSSSPLRKNQSEETNAHRSPSPPRTGLAPPEYTRVTDFTGPTVTQTTRNNPSPKPQRTSESSSEDDDYVPVAPKATKYHDDDREETSSSPSNHHRNQLTTESTSNSSRRDNGVSGLTSQLRPNVSSTTSGSDSGIFELNMSATELRQKLEAKRAQKRDPRLNQQMSMKDKHAFIEQL